MDLPSLEGFSNFFSVLSDLATAAAAVAAVVVAFRGLNAWKAEMLGRRQTQLAEQLLAGFYGFREKVRYFRSPTSYVGEGASLERLEGETEDHYQARSSWFVPIERIRGEEEFLQRLFGLKYEAMAIYGKKAAEPFEDANQVLGKIQFASRMLMKIANRQLPIDPVAADNQLDREEKWQKVIWDGFDEEDDPIFATVSKIVSDVEALTTQHLPIHKK